MEKEFIKIKIVIFIMKGKNGLKHGKGILKKENMIYDGE